MQNSYWGTYSNRLRELRNSRSTKICSSTFAQTGLKYNFVSTTLYGLTSIPSQMSFPPHPQHPKQAILPPTLASNAAITNNNGSQLDDSQTRFSHSFTSRVFFYFYFSFFHKLIRMTCEFSQTMGKYSPLPLLTCGWRICRKA